MSEVREVCDAILADLENNVAGVRGVTRHRYAPWDPERFTSDGKRHLAVWPIPDMERAEPLTTLGHLLISNYVIAYWEPAILEDERQVADEAAAEGLFTIRDAIRDRLYALANMVIVDTFKVWYSSSTTNDATSTTRWCLVTFEVHRAKDFA